MENIQAIGQPSAKAIARVYVSYYHYLFLLKKCNFPRERHDVPPGAVGQPAARRGVVHEHVPHQLPQHRRVARGRRRDRHQLLHQVLTRATRSRRYAAANSVSDLLSS